MGRKIEKVINAYLRKKKNELPLRENIKECFHLNYYIFKKTVK
jgi:hypothetical protein